MTDKTSITEYTEAEFLAFVEDLCNIAIRSESATNKLVDKFRKITEHPDGSDLIFYPRDDREDSPEGIVQEVKEWRVANGKPGFKPE